MVVDIDDEACPVSHIRDLHTTTAVVLTPGFVNGQGICGVV